MKLQRLQIRHFINHSHTNIDFNQTNVFFGPNASGKTAIRNAIEWALNNTTRGMKGRIGEQSLLRTGGTKAEVILNMLAGEKRVEVHRTRTKSQTGLQVTVNEVPLPDMPKLDERALALVLDSTEAIKLDAKARKALFQKYLLPSSTGSIAEHLVREGVDNNLAEATAKQIIEEGLEVAHKTAAAKRLKADQDIQAMPSLDAPEHVITLPSGSKINLDKINIEAVETELKSKAKEAEDLVRKRAEYMTAQTLLSAGQDEIDEIKESIKMAQGELDAMGESEDLDEELKAAQKKTVGAERTKTQTVDDLRDLTQDGIGLANKLDALMSQEVGTCDLCGGTITEKSLESLIKSVHSDIEANKKAQEKASEEMAKANTAFTRLSDTEQKIAETINRDREARNRLSTELNRLNSRLETKDTALQKAKKSKLQEVTDEEMAKLRTSIDDLREAITKKSVYTSILGQQEHQRASLNKMKQEEQTLAALAKLIHPKTGIMADLVEKPMDDLKEQINEIAQQLRFKFAILPDFEIEIDGIPLGFASESEKYRAGILLQIAVAIIANTGIVCIDGADILFGPERGHMLKLIMSTLQARFETILFFGSTEKKKDVLRDSFKHMPFKNISGFWVEDGTVEKL